jgi:RimJ/RimL family protein N-acetyltransferase
VAEACRPIGQNPAMERLEPLPIAADAVLRPFKASDAAELTEAIAANRKHLERWLPWAESHGYEDSVEYLDRKRAQIVLDGRIVGGAGFHGVDLINRSSSIGYWLAADAVGRGLMSGAMRALLDHAFGVWDLPPGDRRSGRRQRPQPGDPGAARLPRGGGAAGGEADPRPS